MKRFAAARLVAATMTTPLLGLLSFERLSAGSLMFRSKAGTDPFLF